jgi:uncharacterized membrane protein YeaQ/YmgE (transglycosylase-associated protein family)
MDLSGETILIILLVGLVVGLLPSTLVERTRGGFIRDIACGIGGIVIAAVLTLAWRDASSIKLWLTKPGKDASINLPPPYEPVVLPLAPLRPLLKPVIYRSREEICDALVRATRSNDLPAHFFIRLLYQESNFRLAAISSAGAQGIAQFMPETATDRGLDNPFDALQAIPASARLLRDLYQKFGNLGLAAAAYNAGPKRIADWRANKGPLPQETQDYVKAITGWPAEAWTDAQAGSPALKLPRAAPCQEFAGLLAWNGPDEIPLPPRNPRVPEIADKATAESHPAKPSTDGAHEKKETADPVKDAKATDVAEQPKSEADQPKSQTKPRSGNGR